MSDRLWFHTIDYREQRGARGLINRGFWLNGTPRLMPLCRIRGHRPVVDGVDYGSITRRGDQRRSRWVCCDRCGTRLLQPVDADLEIGQPYTDPLPAWPDGSDDDALARGALGGQIVIGGAHPGLSAEVKVGNKGSENTLAAHLHLGRLFWLGVHTERHGTWLQRRLNPRGFHSRVIGVDVHHGLLTWQLWAKRDEHSRSDPWWMGRSIRIDPRDVLFGPRRYSYDNVGPPVVATVRMPAGDDHNVRLQLQRRTLGRTRLTRRQQHAWAVDWSTLRGQPGIETRNDRPHSGGTISSGLELAPTTDPERGDWVAEACGAIAAQLTRERARYGWHAPQPAGS